MQSMSLYAAPAWEDVLRHKKYQGLLRRIERKASISVASAYRTVSTDAVGAIAGCPPYDLLARERSQNWKTRGTMAQENHQQMLDNWQLRWRNYAGWAGNFIKDVREWIKRGPATEYYATQAITGHGVFGTYLYEIKKAPDSMCWYECGTPDTPAHTIFECERFVENRIAINLQVGQQVTQQNIAELLVRSREDGKRVMTFLSNIMREKEREERRREGATN